MSLWKTPFSLRALPFFFIAASLLCEACTVDAQRQSDERSRSAEEARISTHHKAITRRKRLSGESASSASLESNPVAEETLVLQLIKSGQAKYRGVRFKEALSKFKKAKAIATQSPKKLLKDFGLDYLDKLIEACERRVLHTEQGQMREELARRTLPLSLEQAPLREVLTALRGATWIKLKVCPEAGRYPWVVSINRDSVSLWEALKSLSEQTGLGFRPIPEGLEIVSKASRKALFYKSYDVSDILKMPKSSLNSKALFLRNYQFEEGRERRAENSNFVDDIQLRKFLAEHVLEDASGFATIEMKRGRCVALQTKDGHKKIQSLLTRLRSRSSKVIKLELLSSGGPNRNLEPGLGRPESLDWSVLFLPTYGVKHRLGVQYFSYQLGHGTGQFNSLPMAMDPTKTASVEFTLSKTLCFRLCYPVSRAYIADYELSSAGRVSELAEDPIRQSFAEQVELRCSVALTKDPRTVILTFVELREGIEIQRFELYLREDELAILSNFENTVADSVHSAPEASSRGYYQAWGNVLLLRASVIDVSESR